MTVTGIRYLCDGAGWGYSVCSNGRYIVVCSNAPRLAIWVWRRNDAGIPQLLLQTYTPVTPSVEAYITTCACWYNEVEARLEIALGTPGDSNPTRKCGSVLFMDWPDSGTVAGDMNELGLVSADLVDQFDPQGIGQGVAMCNGRCIALGLSAGKSALFISRTGDVWSVDKLDTTTYDRWWNFDSPGVELTQHPTEPGSVVGVISCAYYGTYGAHFVVKSTGPGDTWSDLARLDGNEGGGTWYTGRTGCIGPGANGNLTVVGEWRQNPEGFAIWNRDPADPTDMTWIYEGAVKCNNRQLPYGLVVGYNFIAGGENYTYLGVGRVGPINATVFDGPVPGAWAINEFAEFYTAGPGYHVNEDSILHPNGMAISYQEGGIVRVIAGCYNFNPTYPAGTVTGGFTEYNGDDDWPSPPTTPPVAVPTPVDGATDVSVEASLIVDLTDEESDIDASTVIITVDGTIVWTNDAEANGWTGVKSVIATGYSYLLTPPIFFSGESTIVWSVYAEDGDSNSLSDSWTFVTAIRSLAILGYQMEVGPVIGSGVLTYTAPVNSARAEAGEEAYPTAIGSFSAYTTTIHPATQELIKGWQWDKRTWSDDDNDNVVMTVPANYDPSISGITQTYFQSGIGSNRDLELMDIDSLPSSGINETNIFHVWAPEINHGYYYDYEEEGYLFSDDSEIENISYSGVATGIGYDVTSGFNTVTLSSQLKVGVPVHVTQYTWNSEEGKYDYALQLRKRVEFSGTRDVDLARQDTYDTTANRISWDLIDRDEQEFMITRSGETPQILLNNQYVEQVGDGPEASGLEFVDWSTGEAGQQFHTVFAPIDDTMGAEVWSYATVGSGQQWECIDASLTPSGYQVKIDYDLGIVEFGDPSISGQYAPPAGETIGARYWKTLRVEYEPEQSCDTVIASEASVNPIYRQSARGFVYLSTRLADPVSIELAANLTRIQTNIYGPLYIGNTYAPIIATVKDSKGLELEGQTVTFFITSSPEAGSFGGTNVSTTAVTDSEGESKAYYNPPRGVSDTGTYVEADGWTAEDNPIDPTYSGLGQITTLRTNGLLIEGGINDIFLYQIHVDDPLQGYFDPTLSDNFETQVSGYYTQFFQEEGIYGYTGMDPTSSGALSNSVDWEDNRRLLWDLSRPSIFTASAGSGRKQLVSAYDATMLNPHTFQEGAVGPIQPVNVSSVSATEYDVVFDTTAVSIPQPTASQDTTPSGTLHSYFLVAPTTVSMQAQVFNQRLNRNILSNEISVKLSIPSYMNGLWILDAINQSHIDEVSDLLASGITASGQRVPLGCRLRSSRVTLAAALDGVTVLDVNEPTSSGLGYQVQVGHIFS